MPQVTGLRTPPATQGNVLAMNALGTPKRKIARELGIDKGTVDSIIKAYGLDQSQSVSRTHQLTPFAYDAVEKALRAGDARIGMDWLKATVLSQPASQHVHVAGDLSLVSAVGMVPSGTSTASTPSLPSTAGSTGTEAPENLHPVNICLSCPTTFFQELSKQPPKQPITLTCDGQAMQIMRLPGSGEPAAAARVIEVSPLPSSPEQGDEVR